jgi:hypothetical protein
VRSFAPHISLGRTLPSHVLCSGALGLTAALAIRGFAADSDAGYAIRAGATDVIVEECVG